jgi:hypothetical protein
VEVGLPDDPALAGKTLHLQIDMEILYPSLQRSAGIVNRNSYANIQEQQTRMATLVISRPHAGRNYLITWWLATLSGAAVASLACWALAVFARRLGDKALPARVYEPDLSGENEEPRRPTEEGRYRPGKPERDDREDEDRYRR